MSIHDPHEGGRQYVDGAIAPLQIFQSTLPTRGSDIIFDYYLILNIRFQSTLPTRGSDVQQAKNNPMSQDFNPRSPRGGATLNFALYDSLRKNNFNPRSPRGGATRRAFCIRRPGTIYFNPRSPRGGATEYFGDGAPVVGISIHAPHEGERRG